MYSYESSKIDQNIQLIIGCQSVCLIFLVRSHKWIGVVDKMTLVTNFSKSNKHVYLIDSLIVTEFTVRFWPALEAFCVAYVSAFLDHMLLVACHLMLKQRNPVSLWQTYLTNCAVVHFFVRFFVLFSKTGPRLRGSKCSWLATVRSLNTCSI